jgi:PTH1 family peptidyl-tRNA hydrolase
MKLIVGLGNPGSRYQKTRHNIGQRFVDQLKVPSSKLTDIKLHNTSIFMNESGREVKELITNYSLPTINLLVVHDDLDLEPGQWKLQFNRSSAGHKGVQSIIDELGTQEFWRLRIGVGKSPADKTANQFVVEKPSADERKLIKKAIEESISPVLTWVSGNP